VPTQLQHKLGRLLTSVLDDIDLIFLAPVPQRSLSVFGFKCIPPLETPFGFKKFLETRVRAPVPKGRRDGRVPMGQLFFGSPRLMDYELMGGDARRAILDEDAKRNITPTLPPAVAFGSKQFPTIITPGTGPKSLAELP